MRWTIPTALMLVTVAGCGGDPPTIIHPGARTEEHEAEIRRETDVVQAQERANLAGERYYPRSEDQERVEAEEKANLSTTPR